MHMDFANSWKSETSFAGHFGGSRGLFAGPGTHFVDSCNFGCVLATKVHTHFGAKTVPEPTVSRTMFWGVFLECAFFVLCEFWASEGSILASILTPFWEAWAFGKTAQSV